mgnify:CR=1 FL=1
MLDRRAVLDDALERVRTDRTFFADLANFARRLVVDDPVGLVFMERFGETGSRSSAGERKRVEISALAGRVAKYRGARLRPEPPSHFLECRQRTTLWILS